MPTPACHLAQINVARMLYPIEDPGMAGFVAQLDRINALADHAPGFVWRLQDDSGNATGLRPFDDPMIIVNMSVWTSVETLFDFVYRSAHSAVVGFGSAPQARDQAMVGIRPPGDMPAAGGFPGSHGPCSKMPEKGCQSVNRAAVELRRP